MNKEHFEIAKQIAVNQFRQIEMRAKVNGQDTNYTGYKDKDGACWVIGDSLEDIPEPHKYIKEKPALQVFDERIMAAFLKYARGKYPDITKYTRTHAPIGKNYLTKFEIKFTDHSSIIVIMSKVQRDAIKRSKMWDAIKSIGGLGYVKLIEGAN